MNTLTIKLKQHTPLIHFQHDQDGATLRASEVKPKLDKYIIKHEFHDNFDECKKYLVGYNPKKLKELKSKWDAGIRALDYKMSIEASGREEYMIGSIVGSSEPDGKPKEVIILTTTPFFAQEQENRKIVTTRKEGDKKVSTFHENEWVKIPKKGLKWSDVTLEMFSIRPSLIEIIRNHVVSFFICTNFGTRSDKGFGSFTVESVNGSSEDSNFKEEIYEKAFKTNYAFCYKRDFSLEEDYSLSTIFREIKSDYQKLKSGVNMGKYYKKSLLFCYAIDRMNQNPRWEKRHFKQEMKDQLGFTTTLDQQGNKVYDVKRELKINEKRANSNPIFDSKGNQKWEEKPGEFDYKFLRAVLGLADHYEFTLQGKKGKITYKLNDKAIVSVNNDSIKRFQSPLFIKVIDNVVYLLGNELVKEKDSILNQKFDFDYIIKKKVGRETVSEPLSIKDDELSTPTEFSLSKFIHYAICEAKESDRLHYEIVFNSKV